MGYQVYSIGHNRFGGYGVPATCEYPTCKKIIDRGVSYACGGEPFSEQGCDRYFCEKHRDYKYWNSRTGNWCRHQNDCDCEMVQVCERCAKNKPSFPYKKERNTWMRFMLKDESWKEWRDENPETVEEYKKLLN